MRTIKFLSVVVLAMFSFIAHAQDIIVKKDGNTITSKVTEITSSEIKYKKFSNQNGPTYTIGKNEVNYINYENGEREQMNTSISNINTTTANTQSIVQSQDALNPSDAYLLKQFKQDPYSKKAKALKKIAFIGGGALVATGIICIALNTSGDNYEDGNDFWIYGTIAASAGIVLGTSCLIASNIQKKKAEYYAHNIIPLMQMKLLNSKQAALCANIDMFNDNITHKKALGLGFHFNF